MVQCVICEDWLHNQVCYSILNLIWFIFNLPGFSSIWGKYLHLILITLKWFATSVWKSISFSLPISNFLVLIIVIWQHECSNNYLNSRCSFEIRWLNQLCTPTEEAKGWKCFTYKSNILAWKLALSTVPLRQLSCKFYFTNQLYYLNIQ